MVLPFDLFMGIKSLIPICFQLPHSDLAIPISTKGTLAGKGRSHWDLTENKQKLIPKFL